MTSIFSYIIHPMVSYRKDREEMQSSQEEKIRNRANKVVSIRSNKDNISVTINDIVVYTIVESPKNIGEISLSEANKVIENLREQYYNLHIKDKD